MRLRAAQASLFAAAICTSLLAQEFTEHRPPSVKLDVAPVTNITRGKPGTVTLHFEVENGYHVNSNTPTAEFLIPTALRLTAPTDIVIGKITYPKGQDMSFAFAPDEKLSVYSGGFDIEVVVRPLASVVAARYAVHGQLKYQACDKAACYPPKQLPVDFGIQILKGPPPARRNPAQSPHIHG
jgi:hypothetical protein